MAHGYVPGAADERSTLQKPVKRHAEPIRDKNVRAQFTGYAAVQAAA